MFCGVIIWIGIDDTDSLSGGCTTHVVQELISMLLEKGYHVIGYPRLVRLNPNIPWKTRGNGALAFQIGRGAGKKIRIGASKKKELFGYQRLMRDCPESEYKTVYKILKNTIESSARMEDVMTNPGFVLLKKPPGRQWYLKAVQEIVSLDKVTLLLDSIDACYEGYKNKRGLIGAAAAVAWSPTRDSTFELITYRDKSRWGTKRDVDKESVKQMDKSCTTTFDNYDYQNRHNRLMPSSPCPVLFGIRGDSEEELISALSMIKSEPVSSWLLFKTNQGTDDHLQRKTIEKVQPYQSVIIQGTVLQSPRTLAGGHVIGSIKDSTGMIDFAAYEPTKQFRTIVRSLRPGDEIEVYGGVRVHPLTINLEKINVRRLIPLVEKKENPLCTICGKHMKSRGKNQGYKCRRCGNTESTPLFEEKPRMIHKGFYEVPVCARRHLSKPLKRMK